MKRNVLFLAAIAFLCSFSALSGQINSTNDAIYSKRHYLGILPSVLVEPYDTVKAIEVNLLPFTYEYWFHPTTTFQVRPLLNYRILEGASGISHLGATALVNKYLPELFKNEILTPSLGVFTTYTYNRLDFVHTVIVGIEPGVLIKLSERWSLTAALQPGIDFFPDTYSRHFVKSESGFLPHFGFIIHAGIAMD